ncbi:alpha/beta hydrolase [Spirillospora sp. NPDC050679]
MRSSKMWTRVCAGAAAVAAAVSVLGAAPAQAAEPGPAPSFTDGFGLTQVEPVKGDGADLTLTVTTPNLSGKHWIRVFLPEGYAADPGKRWPVLYSLTGGPSQWEDAAGLPALRSNKMITVVPDGGQKGWYADWKMQNTALGAAKWESFHIRQVIPFIDANLRTLTDREHRAVAGLSMGGFGAMHYAQTYPELFGNVASMSGAIDFGLADMRAAVLATELNLPNWPCAAGSSSGCADYGPVVDSDAIFGTPYFWGDQIWNAVNPASTANLKKLANTNIALYTGNQGLDMATATATGNVRNYLTDLGIPIQRFKAYGDGTGWGTGCDGNHNYGCWRPSYADYIPILESNFAAS